MRSEKEKKRRRRRKTRKGKYCFILFVEPCYCMAKRQEETEFKRKRFMVREIVKFCSDGYKILKGNKCNII
jgi:hypothetical protein